MDGTWHPWRDLIGVYAPLADEVERDPGPTIVLSGDCVASLAVLAGVQRRGIRPSLVWFDAHGDFHTEGSTTSGYLGGLALAKAVGRGDLTLPDALGLASLGKSSVTLVDGRDLDPAEAEALAASMVTHISVADLDVGHLPKGPLVVHVDAVVHDRALAALDIATTWWPEDTTRVQTDAVLSALLSTVRLAL